MSLLSASLRAISLVALLLASAGSPAEARSPRAVMLAEAASRVDPAATRLGDLTALLREDAERELAAIDWSALRIRGRYAISATVVGLSTARTGERTVAASCTVSAAVRDASSNILLFVVEGRARAEDGATTAARAERDALRAAVQGAVGRVPEGLRRSR
jgi:hypothetical protein